MSLNVLNDYINLIIKRALYLRLSEYRKMTNYYLIKIDDMFKNNKHYKVINKSKELDEIIYNFDYLTKNI